MDELVKRLRNCVDSLCGECKYQQLQKPGNFVPCMNAMITEAADAIEELSATVEGYESTTNMVLTDEGGKTVVKFEQKWIPVTERLPEAEDMVLVATVHGGVYYGFLHHAGKFYTANNTRYDSWCWEPDVTHWQPLPEPPKEGE